MDYYQMRFDPDDPYVKAAIDDSVRAELVVYSIYWRNQGRADRSEQETSAGQSLLNEVTDATGGKSFAQGMGNPVSSSHIWTNWRAVCGINTSLGLPAA